MALISISVMISDVEQFYVPFDHLYSMFCPPFLLFTLTSIVEGVLGTYYVPGPVIGLRI